MNTKGTISLLVGQCGIQVGDAIFDELASSYMLQNNGKNVTYNNFNNQHDVNNNVNDRQFSIWRRSLKLYSSLKLYRIISCKYERICWIDLCISERYLLFACRTVIRLIVGNSCLSAHSQHIRAEKVCRLCELGVQEDLFHFVWQCIYFDDMRNQMFLKIKDNISEDTYQTLQNVPSNIYVYILLGMQFLINFNDLYTIRKISVRSIFKMYKKRHVISRFIIYFILFTLISKL